ncbi:spindle assembly 6 [Angomonas deanei]|uniref:Uncharacterized protein n=1 Tax=Angomonas deanei TaxID=59799 RepID=A0A7G2CEI8_9TRYP|nr:spindle assembly 6 [Angomonas deanei]CAD2216592.1 hypothetical protein, conserved [Angomonas deanei]|eukprot:EPY23164.1 spindle assembly 6 [Angomonas deanei]
MRNKYEEEIKQLQRSKDQSVQELQATLKAREELLETTQERLTKAEQSVQQQTLLLSSVKEESTALKTELNSIRQTNKELLNFKMETTKMMSENEINYVQVAERLKHLNELNANKEKELQSLREQYNNQDHYIKMLTSQNEKLSLGMAEKESNVEKANYIISNQLNAIKNLKERYKLATDQIKNNNLLLQEKEGSVNRLRDELSQAQEKLSAQLSKINELKLSLSKTEEVKEKLQTELKNNQNALLHLQKSTSINGRHWGLFNGNTTSTTVNQPTSDGPYNFLNQTSLYNAPKYNSVYRPSSTDPLPHSTSNKENGAPVYRHKEESPLVKTEPKLFTGVDVNSQPRHTIKPSYEDAKVVEVVQKGNTPSGTEKSASPLAQRNFFSDENNAYHPSTVAVSSYF